MAAGIAFEALGPVRVLRSGAIVDIGGRRARSVVARLMIADGRVVSAESMVADLWGDDVQGAGLPLLQAQVSQLRRVLEPERAPRTPATVLVSESPGYALRPVLPSDAAQVESLARDGERLLGTDVVAAVSCFERALRMWRGGAYAEFADEAWAQAEAIRLDTFRLRLVERLAEAHSAANDPAAAISVLLPHVAEHALREEGPRLLALALYRSGRQAEALAAISDARRRLVDELGLDLGPDLRRLETDILDHAPHLLALPNPTVAAPPIESSDRPHIASTVGRAGELDLIRNAAERSKSDGLHVVDLVAEAGGGKTALIAEVTAELSMHGYEMCSMVCPDDGAPSGWPWLQALRVLHLRRPAPSDPLLSAWLDDGVATALDADPARIRYRVRDAIKRWLHAAADRPLAIVIDDLHWADEETAGLLVDVAGALERRPVLVVIARRPSVSRVVAHTIGALARHTMTRVELRGLSADDLDELYARVSPNPLDPVVRGLIVSRTNGNPLFARELIRLVAAGAEADEVPDGVRDAVRQRLVALPAMCATLLRVASVGGHELSIEVLFAAMPPNSGDDDQLVDALETALVSGLLTETTPGRVQFEHAIVRDTLYEDMSAVRAMRWHGRFAEILEAIEPDEVIAIARHHAAAGTGHAAAAAAAAVAAAELCERRFAHADAAAWWARAAEAPFDEIHVDAVAQLRLRARQIRALQLSGDIAESRRLRTVTLPIVRSMADPELVATLVLAADAPIVWSARSFAPTEDELVDVCRQAIAGLEDRPDLRSRLFAVIATELESDPGRLGAAAATESLRLARQAGDAEVLAYALHAAYLHTYGDEVEGIERRGEIGREMLSLASVAGLGQFEAAAHLVLTQHACALNDFSAADQHAADGLDAARRYGLVLLQAIAHCYEAMRSAIAGRWDAADDAYMQVGDEVGQTGYYGQAPLLLARFCMNLSADRREPVIGMTDMLLQADPDGVSDETRESTALGLAWSDRIPEARARIGPMLPIRRDHVAPISFAVRGMVGLALDDLDRITDAYESLLPYRGMLCGAQSASVTLGPVATLLAALAVRLGRTDEALAHESIAIDLARSVGNAAWERLARAAITADTQS